MFFFVFSKKYLGFLFGDVHEKTVCLRTDRRRQKMKMNMKKRERVFWKMAERPW
jgi:hypothetical protein